MSTLLADCCSEVRITNWSEMTPSWMWQCDMILSPIANRGGHACHSATITPTPGPSVLGTGTYVNHLRWFPCLPFLVSPLPTPGSRLSSCRSKFEMNSCAEKSRVSQRGSSVPSFAMKAGYFSSSRGIQQSQKYTNMVNGLTLSI